jgi:hypothetical protein
LRNHHSRLATQELIEPGDRVKLVTADDAVHQFRVIKVDVDNGLVVAKNEAVSIADIVGVETREFSVGKTAMLAAGTAYGVYILALIAVAPALLIASL